MSKRKILIIDDEKGFTDMVKLNLEGTGSYDVRIENDSLQGLNTAILYKPDLILLDIIMPQLEGPDVLNELRGNDRLCRVPIIFLTATITKEEFPGRGDIGGHVFLAKPSTLQELIACIEEELHKSLFE